VLNTQKTTNLMLAACGLPSDMIWCTSFSATECCLRIAYNTSAAQPYVQNARCISGSILMQPHESYKGNVTMCSTAADAPQLRQQRL